MKDIAFHLTDIAENGIRAGAGRIGICLHLDGPQLMLRIEDDGCGMDSQTLRRISDPFYTTRTTRRVGLGLPFLFQNAEQCGGRAEVRSCPGRGTQVEACFGLDHIDCPPAGDLAGTLMLLIAGNPEVNVCVDMSCDGRQADLSTRSLREALGDLPLGHPQVALYVRDLVAARLEEVFGGRLR